MSRPPWAPIRGSWVPERMVPGSTEAISLAQALEAVRRSVCCYNEPGSDHDVRCDCKYGVEVGKNPRSGERSGCPELREIVGWLLGWRP